jgi:XTP/dITP diphosphohydrolase
MEITFATTNEGKVAEADRALRAMGISVKMLEIEVPEIKSLSLQETIERKAETAFHLNGRRPVVVEDTGIFLAKYPDFPGTYTKFAIKTIGLPGVLKLLEGEENRQADFKTAVAFISEKQGKPVVFTSVCKGRLLENPVGQTHPKLPYDSVFVAEGFSEPFSLMTPEEKDRLSARGKAFRQLGEWLKQQEESSLA